MYATGFDAIAGSYDRVYIGEAAGQRLKDKWATAPAAYLGNHVAGFANLLKPTGPQGGSASRNFPPQFVEHAESGPSTQKTRVSGGWPQPAA